MRTAASTRSNRESSRGSRPDIARGWVTAEGVTFLALGGVPAKAYERRR